MINVENNNETEDDNVIVEDKSEGSEIGTMMAVGAGVIGLLTLLLLITFMIRKKWK